MAIKYDGPKAVNKMFAAPPMFYALNAFWFWDDKKRNENFAAPMAKEMTKQRLNPGYTHPRSSQKRGNKSLASLPYEHYLENDQPALLHSLSIVNGINCCS